MTNHVQFMVNTGDKEGVSSLMQYTVRRYVPYVNHTYGTGGSILRSQYKTLLFHTEQYLLICDPC